MTTPENFVSLPWERADDPVFERLLGPLWIRMEEAGPAYGLQTQERHDNGVGSVHGGVLAALADHALGRTLRMVGDWPRQATAQLDLQYVSAARPGDFVEARAEIVRSTAHLAFMRGILSVDERVVATAHGVWKISRRRKPSPGGGAGGDAA